MVKKFLAVIMTAAVITGSAFAADFTNSVTAKDAPEVVTVKTADGNDAAGIIYDADGKEVAAAGVGEVVVTPYSKKDSQNDTIKSKLEKAYEQAGDKSVTDLSADASKVLDGAGLKADEVVVSDVFDVDVTDDILTKLNESGNTLKITFKANVNKGDFLMVMTNCGILDGDSWKVVPAENVVINGDGTVTVTFTELCPVLFVTDGAAVSVDPAGPNSPQTSDDANNKAMTVAVAAVAVVALGAIAFVATRKNER